MLKKEITLQTLEEQKPKTNKRLLFLIKYTPEKSIYKVGTAINDELFMSQNKEYFSSTDIICWCYLPFDTELDAYFYQQDMK